MKYVGKYSRKAVKTLSDIQIDSPPLSSGTFLPTVSASRSHKSQFGNSNGTLLSWNGLAKRAKFSTKLFLFCPCWDQWLQLFSVDRKPSSSLILLYLQYLNRINRKHSLLRQLAETINEFKNRLPIQQYRSIKNLIYDRRVYLCYEILEQRILFLFSCFAIPMVPLEDIWICLAAVADDIQMVQSTDTIQHIEPTVFHFKTLIQSHRK